MSVVPIYTFLRHSGKVPNFHGENLATCHPTFAVKIRHRVALGDTDYDNHTERGEQVYIYTHHSQCKHTERKGNGTLHDIPNTTHLREKGKRKEGV